MFVCRWFAFAWIAAALCSAAPSLDRAVMKQYCYGCHNSKGKQGNLALDALHDKAIADNPEVWEKVLRKVRARHMPPVGLPRPNEATYNTMVSALEGALDQAAAAHPNPGRTDTFRRLNRTEYQNVIRDLLALEVDVANMLPNDESSHGFDNITVADLPPTLLERYITAARRISRLAVGSATRSPGGDLINLPPDLTQEDHFDGLPLGTRGGTAVRYTFPLEAEYDFQIRLARDRNERIEGLYEPHQIELLIDGVRTHAFTVKPPPAGQDHSQVDQHLNIRLPLKPGPHMVAATFIKKPWAMIETARQPYQANFNMDRHPRIQPAVYSVSITGPYNAKGPGDTPSRQRIFVCKPGGASEEEPCAVKILSTLMQRAYRRPVNADDTATAMKLYRQARKDGDFEAGIELALRSILVNPEFLFRVENTPAGLAAGSVYKLSDLDLATRLSFFLWSSIPDEELLQTAIAGNLRRPKVLETQVRRMLADERARTLVTNFAGQWLYLRNLASANPDMRLFPDFDDNLRQAFLKETELFVESVWREDRNVFDLLNANYTYVNERLAKHYGIPNVYGSRFRKVTFELGAVRGGLLRQGSVLTVTSYATRTSPVIRGKWVLDNVLGVPPPPPPAVVPAIKEDRKVGEALNMRQRIAEHRANPACAGCHNIMDPVGFAFENYDAIGRWRTVEEGQPIDTSGVLPDGTHIQDLTGLQKAITSKPEFFAMTLTEKLLTYGLGRGTEYYDAPAVRKIVAQARTSDYKFSSFILGIVQSTPFQMRRSQ
ncbi:MAG: DUF1592 domain-containing protein [Bryobacterales bacterium]|nr:DUF1592 domain-containing protein [Bryobacterales bacterium]